MLSAAVWLMISSMLYSLRLDTGTFPKPLSAKEERHYLELAKAGDQNARNVLIERNLRLVVHVTKKYFSQTADQEDLVSIGTIGLIKGISTFDPDNGTRLATYAARCVENEILMHFRRQKKTASDVSLSELLETGKDGTSLSLMDVMCSEEDLFTSLSEREAYGALYRAVGETLTPRERKVIRLRYGLGMDRCFTQKEVGDALGISRSYVSRIEKKALGKLRQALGEDYRPGGD